ncbi:MAG: hypothetical protein K5656_00440 [Lachnospiraceae bacterium]|nr:hypothetical protein [Lachnospiraceae bacterium]
MQNKNYLSTIIIVVVIIGVLAFFKMQGGSQKAIANIPEPIQTEARGQTKMTIDDIEATINYLYSYDIDALVVHTKNYSGSGVEAKFAPKDLALAWGDVAAHNKDIDFHWSQSNRWYFWRVKSYDELAPVGNEEDVSRQSSNNHVIAADDAVRSTVKKIRTGDHVHLKGYLINLEATDSKGGIYTWNSSTSRTDSGDHSCELIYVTEASIVN